MASRRSAWRIALVAAAVLIGFLARPDAPEAQANPLCGLAGTAISPVTGAIGIGNPVGDACNAVTDGAVGAITSPISGAIEGIGNSIFGQITDWVSGGASWLIGQVVRLSDETTTPDLTTEAFTQQYRKMAAIAVFLAVAMLLFAVLESLGQGSGLLRVVFVNLPLALIASSVAFVVVQMLITATDGVSHAVAVSTEESSQHFFHGAIEGLGGVGAKAGEVGSTGAGEPAEAATKAAAKVEVPLFVTFLAAVIGAFAAFFVWIELLMRDAAVYVVALFAPMALAASIWPRWAGALRRTAELLCVVIASKFVIVAIIALAAGLADQSGGKVEHVLAAAALMLLACFAPFVLFKLVPFAEGAVASAYGRHSASGGVASGAQLATSAMVMRNTASSHWGGGGSSAQGGGGGGKAGGSTAPKFSGGTAARGSGAEGSSAGKASEAGKAGTAEAGPVAAAVKAPVAAERGSRNAAERLSQSGTAQAAGGGGGGGGSTPPQAPSSKEPGSGGSPPPKSKSPGDSESAGSGASKAPRHPAPPESSGGNTGGESRPAGGQPPRPAAQRPRSSDNKEGKK